MATVFISYRGMDQAAAERLAVAIRGAGHAAWFAPWEIDLGDSIVERMSQGLQNADYLLLCCSAAGESSWMSREWMAALALQLQGHGIKVLPVLLSGGKVPVLLADIRYADLVQDWRRGVASLLRAIH